MVLVRVDIPIWNIKDRRGRGLPYFISQYRMRTNRPTQLLYTAEAGRSTTSPAAIWLATASVRMWMMDMEFIH
jgi:hypothetical protein